MRGVEEWPDGLTYRAAMLNAAEEYWRLETVREWTFAAILVLTDRWPSSRFPPATVIGYAPRNVPPPPRTPTLP